MNNSDGTTPKRRYETPTTAVLPIMAESLLAASDVNGTNVTVGGWGKGGSIDGGTMTPTSSGAKRSFGSYDWEEDGY